MSASEEVWSDAVRATYADAFGDAATLEEGFGPVTVDIPVQAWVEAVTVARDRLGCRFFDFLSAVDEAEAGLRLVCHLAALPGGGSGAGVRHLVLRCLLAGPAPSVAHVYAGARWHERETAEMFGIGFTGPDGSPLRLETLLLPDGFEGHPLRKDFVLASRVAKPWPGAKEPGESDHDAAPSRRRTRPPGVPEGWRR